jgi:hypothetical protein
VKVEKVAKNWEKGQNSQPLSPESDDGQRVGGDAAGPIPEGHPRHEEAVRACRDSEPPRVRRPSAR